MPHPQGISRHLKFSDMDISVEQTPLIQRTLLAVHLCLDLP